MTAPIKWGECSPQERSLFHAGCISILRVFLERHYEAGLGDAEARAILDKFVGRMDKLRKGDNPFVILQKLLQPLRQVDFTNGRLRGGGTHRAAKRRRNRLERGEIKSEAVRIRGKSGKRRMECSEEDSIKLPLRDMVFPRGFVSDETLDRYCDKHDIQIDIEGDLDGRHTLRLEAMPQGSWALYALEEESGGYVRTFMLRETGFRTVTAPCKGKEVRHG